MKHRHLKKINYKGFSIEEELEGELFAVRMYQKNPDLMHDFKPWCESIAEARKVVDKLVEREETFPSGRN